MGGEARAGRGEPGEEVLGRSGRPIARRSRGRARRRRSARPRELVDRTAVEIVDEGVRVAVERVGGGCGRGVGESCELVAHVLVERRSPERVPPSVGRLEMRVHEPGGDRAARRAQHLEDDPGAPAELDILGRRVDELEQLVELEQPRRDAALGEGEVGDRRHPELELAGGELAVGVADERKGARVLLPQELEGRRRLGDGHWGGRRHEPLRIRATGDSIASSVRRSSHGKESLAIATAGAFRDLPRRRRGQPRIRSRGFLLGERN